MGVSLKRIGTGCTSLVVAAVGAAVLAPSPEALTTPQRRADPSHANKLTLAAEAFSPGSGGQGVDVDIYSKTRFTFHNQADLQRLANAYRPYHALLVVGHRTYSLRYVNEAMPEFVFMYHVDASLPVGTRGIVRFKNGSGKHQLPVTVVKAHGG